jgi:hypothetical protein
MKGDATGGGRFAPATSVSLSTERTRATAESASNP